MNRQFNFTLEEGEVNLILEALSKLPLEKVLTTFSKIKLTAEEQLQAKKEVVEETKEG